MKKTLTIALSLLSLNAFASFNELECEGTFKATELNIEVEQPFPNSSAFRRMSMTVASEGAERSFDYHVTARRSAGFNRIQYMGAGMRLEVDLWPDNTPRWGRTYRATVNSSDLATRHVSNLSCRFPNSF